MLPVAGGMSPVAAGFLTGLVGEFRLGGDQFPLQVCQLLHDVGQAVQRFGPWCGCGLGTGRLIEGVRQFPGLVHVLPDPLVQDGGPLAAGGFGGHRARIADDVRAGADRILSIARQPQRTRSVRPAAREMPGLGAAARPEGIRG